MPLDRVSLKTLIEARIADNTTGQTNEDDFREVLNAIVDSFVNTEDEVDILTCDITIESADLLANGGAGIELLPAAGAGLVYQVIGQMVIKYIYGTIDYATNTDVKYSISGVDSSALPLLSGSVDRYAFINPPEVASNATSFEDVAVLFKVHGGNPTAGDGTVRVVFKYKILQL